MGRLGLVWKPIRIADRLKIIIIKKNAVYPTKLGTTNFSWANLQGDKTYKGGFW